MLAPMLFISILASVTGHVPFFASGSDNEIQRESKISQVYYFKHSGQLYGKKYMLDKQLVEILGPEQTAAGCNTSINCDGNVTVFALTTQNGANEEPFTQSRYYKYFSEIKSCHVHFSVNTNCSSPWAAVVGKEEEFYLTDYAFFPMTIARIHGSWWNNLYIVGWFLLALLFIPIVATSFKTRKITKGFLLAAAITYIAFFIDKLVATIRYTPTASAAWVLSFAEILPLILIWRLVRAPGYIVAGVTIVVSVFLFFAAGVGFVIGNFFLLVAGVLMFLNELKVIE